MRSRNTIVSFLPIGASKLFCDSSDIPTCQNKAQGRFMKCAEHKLKLVPVRLKNN